MRANRANRANRATQKHWEWTAWDSDRARETLTKTQHLLDDLRAMAERTHPCLLQSQDALRHAEQRYQEMFAEQLGLHS
jgi:hypothetical protein